MNSHWNQFSGNLGVMWNSKVFVVLNACYAIFSSGLKTEAEDIYHWKTLEFENLPLPEDAYIGKYPYYIPENVDTLGLIHHVPSGLMVITAGRIRPGVPSALNAFCIADYEKGSSPKVWGFPDYERNTLKPWFNGHAEDGLRFSDTKYSSGASDYFRGEKSVNSARKWHKKRPSYSNSNSNEDYTIIAVYSPVLHSPCNRMYLADTGNLLYTGIGAFRVQSPSLLVYDLPADGCKRRHFPLIRRLEIPSHLYKDPSGFIHETIDQQPNGSCDDIIVYLPNIFDSILVVCDYKKGEFWSLTDPTMSPVYVESFMVFKHDFHYFLQLGLLNIALGPQDKDGNRNAYYTPGASSGLYAVSTKLLKDPKRSSKYNPEDFRTLGYRGCNTQVMYQFIDLSTGVMFFGETQSHRLSCWNTKKQLSPDTIGVAFQSDELHFVSDFTLDIEGNLLILTNHLPIIYRSVLPLNLTEVISRIYRIKASDAIRGTVCDVA